MTKNDLLCNIPTSWIILTYFDNKIPNTASNIRKETKVTYSHLQLIMKLFKEKKWVTFKRQGKTVEFLLTQKGQKIKLIIIELFNELEINNNNYHLFRYGSREKNKKLMLEKRRV